MFDYLHLFFIFTLPVFLCRLKTFHRGLITGLFLSLLYWGVLLPVIVFVPISAGIYLFFGSDKPAAEVGSAVYIRKPAQRLFMAFLIFMVIYCAFGGAVFQYGTYIKASGSAFRVSSVLGTLGLLLGPIIIGFWCDKKGSFGAAVFLTLSAEIAIGLASLGEIHNLFWSAGWFVQQLVISGFLTLVPLISLALIGRSHFLKVYPEMAITLFITWGFADFLYARSPEFSENPGDLLMTLVFLPLLAVFFIVIAWQRRFVLVAPVRQNKVKQRAGGFDR